MTIWDPSQYLRFADHRERPFDELIARVPLGTVGHIVDLGCGPGTATVRLLDRWPEARVLGVDSSAEMIGRAASLGRPGQLDFEVGDVRTWSPAVAPDVIVSNAMLQWVPGHADLLGGLLDVLAPGGVLAFQVPANFDAAMHTELQALAGSDRWSVALRGVLRRDAVLPAAAYLRRLLDLGADADVWETTYQQVLHGPDAVLEWARGTALRPVLSLLPPAEAAAFEAAYGAALRAAYPTDTDGRTVLAFRRIFAVARRPA